MRLSVHHAIACDDVRHEDNGKAILIGVYSGHIHPRQLPAKVKLAFWIVGQVDGDGALKMEVRITFRPKDGSKPFGQVSPPIEGSVSNTDGEPQDFQFAVISEQPLEFSGPGLLTVEVRAGDGAFAEVLRKRVLPQPTGSVAQRSS